MLRTKFSMISDFLFWKRFTFHAKRSLNTQLHLGLITALVIFVVPIVSLAQRIEWAPGNLDFGEVVVGESLTKNLTIKSTGHDLLDIYYVGLLSSPSTPSIPVFDVTLPWSPSTSVSIEPEDETSLSLTFSPRDLGTFSGSLIISSNDSHGNALLVIPVLGRTPSPVPEPASITLFGIGLPALLVYRARRKR